MPRTLYELASGDLSATQHELCVGLAHVLAATMATMTDSVGRRLRLDHDRQLDVERTTTNTPDELETQKMSTATAFVEIVESLIGDFDVIDVLTGLATRSVELLRASEAGILLADPSGQLIVTAASSEQVGLLELFQIQNQQGPCLDCYTGGVTVTHAALDQGSPWPLFAAESVKSGFPSVFAVPLRLKSSTIGCLNLFMSESVVLSRSDIVLAQALADVATIVIIQDQAAREAAQRVGSLQNALTSRIAIEQAKGMIAERFSVDMNTAFGRLRTYARRNNQRLSDVAAAVASGDLTISAVNGATRLPPPPTRTQPVAEPARSDRPTT